MKENFYSVDMFMKKQKKVVIPVIYSYLEMSYGLTLQSFRYNIKSKKHRKVYKVMYTCWSHKQTLWSS